VGVSISYMLYVCMSHACMSTPLTMYGLPIQEDVILCGPCVIVAKELHILYMCVHTQIYEYICVCICIYIRYTYTYIAHRLEVARDVGVFLCVNVFMYMCECIIYLHT